MTASRVFSISADPSAHIPARESARLDRLEAAIASLAAEERRLERLGFERPLAECRRQRRYWEFVRAILALAPATSSGDAPRFERKAG
jgi:hypothetical protein